MEEESRGEEKRRVEKNGEELKQESIRSVKRYQTNYPPETHDLHE